MVKNVPCTLLLQASVLPADQFSAATEDYVMSFDYISGYPPSSTGRSNLPQHLGSVGDNNPPLYYEQMPATGATVYQDHGDYLQVSSPAPGSHFQPAYFDHLGSSADSSTNPVAHNLFQNSYDDYHPLLGEISLLTANFTTAPEHALHDDSQETGNSHYDQCEVP